MARIAAFLAIAVGCALAGWTLMRAFDEKPTPMPLIIGLLGAAVLEIVTGILMLSRRRAAWSFAVSLTGVMVLAAFLALPAMVKAGVAPALAGTAMGVGIVLLALLAISREQF